MNVITREKFKVLADLNGWSLEHARGFVDGETTRKRRQTPSVFALNGIDEYCLGFRAGFFERRPEGSTGPAKSEAPGKVLDFAKPR